MMSDNAKADANLSSAASGSKPYADCQVGEHFFYGTYPQDENGEAKPIEWRVLARESDRLLVLAEYCLDAKAYNDEDCGINWMKCTLRSWLNGEFLNKAFTAEEQRNLLNVSVNNPRRPAKMWEVYESFSIDSSSPEDWDHVPGGCDTSDNVFLLSLDEIDRYFSSNDERCCKPTAYAVKQGVANIGNCTWWLRSPGHTTINAASICSEGGFFSSVVFRREAVRPAVFLAL